MRDPSDAARCLSIVFVFVMALNASAQSTTGPIGSILNADGSINLNLTGSFDPSGYRLIHGPNGEPRFVSETQSLGGSCAPDGWDTNFSLNGTDQRLLAIASDGLGNFYIGGYFTAVNNVAASQVAKWNGTSWSALGSGISGGEVIAIAVSGSNVYFAGSFTSAGGIPVNKVAKWDGSSWSALGAGLGGSQFERVNAIAASGNDVYAGGTFLATSGFPNRIARWNGTEWVSMGTGVDDEVFAIAVSGTDVYAGGRFATAGGVPAGRIAKWDGNAWSALGAGHVGRVLAIAVSGTDVYAGGVLGGGSGNIRKWDGSSWQSLGSGVTGGVSPEVSSIAISGADVYVSGSFNTAGGSPANHIARWNGTQWSALGTGLGSGSSAMAVSGSTILVGGSFSTAGGLVAKNIAAFTSGTWTPFYGTGVEAGPIAVSGTDVYVGGSFTLAGTVPANRIAKWNGSAWSALGSGVNGSVSAITVAGNKVYVGGSFTNAGGVSANRIAFWNGTNWAPLGSGVNGTVTVIIVRGEEVIVGGDFTTAGGVSANRIAKWNGGTWSGLNSSILPTTVSAIATLGNDLYVGTGTTTAVNPAYFSKYDGTTWTPMGAGLGDTGVSSIAVLGTDIYVTGGFTSVDGVTVNRIAKWNGSSWSALGGGLPANTTAIGNLRVSTMGPDLIATGDFTTAAGAAANYIARWNGTSWSALGAGLNGVAGKATAAGGDLWVGGLFTTAGCNFSPYLARWRENVWTGSASADWHNTANWGSGSVPPTNAGITIAANNATISSSDVAVSGLIVTGGRTLAIGAGRTLTVNGTLDLTNGDVTGPGTLVVNGDLNLNNANVSDLGSLTINGSLDLSGGNITGPGTVSITECRVSSLVGGNSTFFVASPLTRCVNSSGTYRFPVGTGTTYAPVELSNITGSGNLTVESKAGAHPGATGLPPNRLQRWWNMTNSGITQANLVFSYLDSEVVGLEHRYRVYSINGGAATQLPTTLNQTTNRATVTGATSFAQWTLAEGTPAPSTLFGRVTNPSGRGVSRMLVSLDDGQGNIRYVVTNHLGYYRFTNVPTFNVYTVRVVPKKYSFTNPERVVDFDEFTTSINFVSSDN